MIFPRLAGRIYIILWCVVSPYCEAQTVEVLPDDYRHSTSNYSLINPGAVFRDGRGGIRTGLNQRLGAFRVVRTFYSNIQLPLTSAESDRVHVLGISAFSNQRGEIINRNRFFFHYVGGLQLSETLRLTGGTYLGASNYRIASGSVSTEASLWAVDGHIGLELRHPRFRAGVSVNQIFDNQISPGNTFFHYVRHANVYAEMNKEISVEWAFRTGGRLLVSPQNQPLDLFLGVSFQETVGLNLFYHTLTGLGGSILLFKFPYFSDRLDFLLVYNFPVFQQAQLIPFHSIEASLGIYL